MAPSSTIIITGGTGNLGSTLAKTLATLYPGRFYVLLTCRNLENAAAVSLQNALRSKDAQFSLEKLDLSDLDDVRRFTENVKQRITSGTLPGLVGGGIVNSAAFMTFTKDSKTSAGLDDMYTVNALAPALLARNLLGVMGGKGGGEGAIVVNVGSQAHEMGRVDYFQQSKESGNKGAKTAGEGERLGFMEVMKRYGSSKLLLIMMSYAFQRHLYSVCPSQSNSQVPLKISLKSVNHRWIQRIKSDS
jgi:NAD(P)-dependent dehydrogenase (short-subunit alcohol dehydrogenase family)